MPKVTGEDLKRYRANAGWSVRQMAAYLDISKSKYSRLENGAEVPEVIAERVWKAFVDFHGVMSVAVDYLRISFETLSLEEVIQGVLRMRVQDFLPGGGNASMAYVSSGNYAGFNYLRVWSRQADWTKPGAAIQMSGKGVRLFEFIMENSDRDCPAFLSDAQSQGGNFTRIDIAVNDYVGWFDMNTLFEKVETDQYVTQFRSRASTFGNKYDGRTISFGTRGNLYVRFYEKAKEVASRLGTDNYEYGIINRYELQISDTAKATTLINSWIKNDDLVEMTFGFFNRYITILDDCRSDLPTEERKQWEPWNLFVKGAKKVQFETMPEPFNIERTFAWIENSVAGSLQAMAKVKGWASVLQMTLGAEMSPKLAKAVGVIVENIEAANEAEKMKAF